MAIDQYMFSPPPQRNPLTKYMRMPGLHIKLPTNGVFLPPGAIEFTMNGDVPIYPMRSADELLLKSPDALMSGYAIEELIKSCVPAIKTPRLISSPDLDALLMAIWAATNGEVITYKPTCPSCAAKNEVQRNLSYLMSTMQFIDKDNPVRLSDDVIVYLRPYNMGNATRLNLVSFEEARRLQAYEASPVSERTEHFNQSMQRIIDITMELMADSVLKVVTPDGEVTDHDFIQGFINDISKPWTDKLRQKLDELNKKGITKSYEVTCASCGHEWEAEIEFDPATFFGASS